MKSTNTLLKEFISQQIYEVQRAASYDAYGNVSLWDFLKPVSDFLRVVFRQSLGLGYSALKGVDRSGRELGHLFLKPFGVRGFDRNTFREEQRRRYLDITGGGVPGLDLSDYGLENCIANPALCLARGVLKPKRSMGSLGVFSNESFQQDIDRLIIEADGTPDDTDATADLVQQLITNRDANVTKMKNFETKFRINPIVSLARSISAAKSVDELLFLADGGDDSPQRKNLQEILETVEERLQDDELIQQGYEIEEFEEMLLRSLKYQIITSLRDVSEFELEVKERLDAGQTDSPIADLYIAALRELSALAVSA